jgi:hypothetical protein
MLSCRAEAGIDLDALRRAGHPLRHVAHRPVERRREQHRLARSRRRGNDPFDVFDETHVEHAVGFVENQHLQQREVDLARTHVVDQPARRRDQNLGVAPEKFHLLRIGHAAEDRHGPHLMELATVLFGRRSHLQREFAGRRQHQHARLCRLEALAFVAASRATVLAHRASGPPHVPARQTDAGPAA